MAAFKLKLLKSTNSLIVLLISILGFSLSCKKEEVRYAYGSPTNNYVIIKGKVLSDANDQTVPEIIIEIREVVTTLDGESHTQLWRTSFSDTHGDYSTPLSKDKTYQLRFVDTDGILNGEFETKDTTVISNSEQFPKESKGAEGVSEKVLNIKLKPKQ